MALQTHFTHVVEQMYNLVKTGVAFLILKNWNNFHFDKKGRLKNIKQGCILTE